MFLIFKKTSGVRFEESKSVGLMFPQNYEFICTVDVERLPAVFETCNTKPWDVVPWYQDGAVELCDGSHSMESLESLSVGDIAMDAQSGIFWEVGRDCWRQVDITRIWSE